MIFDVNNLSCIVLQKFNSTYNYFNPSHFNGRTIFRRESKFENKVLISDIVDNEDNVILHHHVDDNYLWSYEDARFINHNEISVCCCKRDKYDLTKIINVEFKKYNLLTKQFTHFKTQNHCYEKHWQFYDNKIIYHVNPYTILNNDETVFYKKLINWKVWEERYGEPRLSTNIFEVEKTKYLIFHSSVWIAKLYYKYFVGLLRINDDLSPLCYYNQPLFISNREYTSNDLITDLWNWRKTELCEVVKYEVIFPMNVIVDSHHINVYSGLNDCSAVNIQINKKTFVEKINNETVILV